MKRICLLIMMALGLLTVQKSQAQQQYEEYTNAFNGSATPLNIGDILIVSDALLDNPSSKPTILHTNATNNIVTAAFNEPFLLSKLNLPDSFSITLKTNIYVLQTAGGTEYSTTKDFVITYSKSYPYKKSDIFYFNNGRRVRVQITDIQATGITVPVAQTLLLLTNDLRIDRDYDINCSDCGLTAGFGTYPPSLTDATDILTVSWPANKAAKMYDLEWVYIDQAAYNDGRYGDPSSLGFAQNIFQRNSSRVTTTGLTYNIPLLFSGNGYVFFRYRAVQNLSTGERVSTKWSYEYNLYAGLGKTAFAGHANNLNWQMATSFAEDGKKKSVVQYFDGLLKERQTVTKNSTTNTTIVAENLYDHQGRPAISILPAPTLKNVIQYSPLFARDLNSPGSEYTKTLYDGVAAPGDYCSLAAPPMDTTEGASKYYSPANPQVNVGANKYIPDAMMYPFAETKYTQDNTGRIAAQGGVGPSFKLGGGHETKYYYGAPTQAELDALFGTDAGDASHYQKNMVRDANGQYSVSYVDMKGRTIATALAGNAPGNMNALDSYNHVQQTESLLAPTNNLTKGNSIVFSKSIVVTKEQDYKLTYSLDPQTLKLPNWKGQQICYDCLYDLTITITDDCNNQNMSGGVPFVFKKSNFSLNSINANCSDSARKYLQNLYPIHLMEGTYNITKELSLSKSGKQYYLDSIYTPNNLKTTFDTIYTAQMAIVKQQLGSCDQTTAKENDANFYRDAMYTQMTEGRYKIDFNKPVPYTDINDTDLVIQSHPEYKVYQRYQTLQSSNDWDKAMGAITTYSDAASQGYLNPLQMTTAPASKFSSNPDPFFQGNTTYYAMMHDSLQYAMPVSNAPVSYANMWAVSNMVVKCGVVNNLMDPACITKFSDNNNVFSGSQLCVTELDDAWNKFKNMYYAKKQIVARSYLFSTGYPQLDSEQYRLFIDPLKMINKDSLGVDPNEKNPSVLLAQANDALNKEINDNCNNYANYWWNRLNAAGCGFVPSRDSAILVSRLINVCKAGGDQSHPFGASTVKPGSSNTFASFNDAIVDYVKNTLGGNFQLCNGLLIDAPAPYDQPIISANKPIVSKPDECECKNIKGLYQVYNARYTTKYATMSDFMKKVYNTDISNGSIDSLLKLCNDQLTCTRITNPIILPPVMQCGNVQNVCVNCEIVAGAYNAFKATYNTITPSKNDTLQQNIFFAGYMFDKTGVRKTATEYLNFIDSCNVSSGNFAGSTVMPDSVSYAGCIKDTIAFPATGVGEPFSCDDLIRTYNNFIAEFPNHTHGATVRMYIDPNQYAKKQNRISPKTGLLAINATPVGSQQRVQASDDNGVTPQANMYSFAQNNFPNGNDHVNLAGENNLQNEAMSTGACSLNSNLEFSSNQIETGQPVISQSNVINIDNSNDDQSKVDSLPYDTVPKMNVDTLPQDTVPKINVGRSMSVMPAMSTIPTSYWIDTTLTARQLFEWYMGEHLGTPGFTCEDYADFLINDCGYKLHQLPWSDTIYVRQDTLQNIWNRFNATYPVSQLTITEEVNVPITKGGTISDQSYFEQPDGTVLDAYAWPDGGYGTMRSTNSFGLSILPANASINYASLSLFANNAQYNYASHFRNYDEYPQLVLAQVNSIYIPNVTTWDNQPDLYPGGSVAEFDPLYIESPVSGYPDGFWSDQDYTYQDAGALVQSMYNNLQSTGVNYPIVYMLNDEYADYKLFQFGGSDCPDDSKKPILSVSYSAARQDVFAAFVNNALGTFLSIDDIRNMYSSKGKLLLNSNCTSASPTMGCGGDTLSIAHVEIYNSDLLLCGDRTGPTFIPVSDSILPTASKDSAAMAYNAAMEIYNYQKDSLLGNFDLSYNNKCLGAAPFETLQMVSDVTEYHYTLYYYDQAGNLVKTAPPAAVTPNRDPAWLAQVAASRAAGQPLPMQYSMATLYRYNSLNQVVSQYSPDGNQTNFWYDKMGRIAVSRNAVQQTNNLYSYTLYDALGRIREVGQKPQPNEVTDAITRDTVALHAWVNYSNTSYPQQQVTRTVYDQRNNIFDDPNLGFNQNSFTLRNRVAYTQYFDQLGYSGTDNGFDKPNYLEYDYGVYYGYDIHGNVDTLFHDYRTGAMATNGWNRYKMVTYDYDLVSGKVNLVGYQPGKIDELYHRYNYDAENKLTDVFTTHRKPFVGDGNVEEREANYSYYLHGPLARTEIGNNKVQGVDYAYTLQGWLKGVNSTSLNPVFDMGNDGNNSTSMTAKDALGFSLNYFIGDYKAIDATVTPFSEAGSIIGSTDCKPLYNGNISNMSVAVKNLSTQLYNYKYDQLNRLINMSVYKGLDTTTNLWNGIVPAGIYGESISYDANGNIKTYNRDGNKTGTDLTMDSLNYHYIASTNKLDYITDIGTNPSAYDNDLETQSAGNYQYDQIGNLIHDDKNNIDVIEWTVYGKIRKITKKDGSTIQYAYDAAGNRISKTSGGITTWYVRDGQGNTLGTYEINGSSMQLKEQDLYGSSRLGIFNRNLAVNSSLSLSGTAIPSIGNVFNDQQQRGQRQYELNNHLGNVLATITDVKIPYSVGGTLVDYYLPSVVSSQDYYPFGMQMPGRSSNSGTYRYGFNGKENDNDVKGNGNQQDYGMRIYDPRVGRFLSVDPITKSYPELTPYQFASNTPIQAIDLDGKEKLIVIISNGQDGKPKIDVYTDKKVIEAMWQSISSASSLGDKKLVWNNDNAASVYHDANSTRYKWYSEGSKTNAYYPSSLEGCGILSIDTRGKDVVASYYDWANDYSKKVQGAEDDRNKQIVDVMDKTLTVAALVIGVGELKAAIDGAEVAKIVWNGVSVAATLDDLTEASSKIDNETIKTAIEHLKTAIAVVNIKNGIKDLPKAETAAEKGKTIYNGGIDTKTVLTTLKNDVQKLNEEKDKIQDKKE